MDKYYNPYQMQELRFPKIYQEQVQRFTQTKSEDGKKIQPSQSPFPRMVDIWLLAVCFGARKGKRNSLSKEETYKVVEGTIFTSDSWRVDLISLLAIGYTSNAEILNQPREVIQLLNELAAAGLPEVFQMLQDGYSEPIWNISTYLIEILNESQNNES